ncbi:MAG: excisionase family DNA-binding protein [Planctomycetota bacterium]
MNYLTVAKAADQLGLHLKMIYKMVHDGRLVSRKVGHQYLVDSESVEQMRRLIATSLTPEQAAAELGCSTNVIYQRIGQGRLAAERIGKCRRIAPEEWARFRALVESGEEGIRKRARRPKRSEARETRNPEAGPASPDPDVLILPDQVTEALGVIAEALKPHRGGGPDDGASMFSDIKAIRETLRKSDGKLGRLPHELQSAVEQGVALASKQLSESFAASVSSMAQQVSYLAEAIDDAVDKFGEQMDRLKGSPIQLVHDRMAGIETQMSLINGSLRSLGAKTEEIQS